MALLVTTCCTAVLWYTHAICNFCISYKSKCLGQYCSFSVLFLGFSPHLFWSAFGCIHLGLSCTFLSHPASLLSARFSEGGHDAKSSPGHFLNPYCRDKEEYGEKEQILLWEWLIHKLCSHKRKWDLISLRISLQLWTTLAWIHQDRLSSLTLYAILFAFYCLMIVTKKKMLFEISQHLTLQITGL